MDRVEAAAKAPKEPVPVFKSQDSEAPATIAEVQQEVAASTTTKVCFGVVRYVHAAAAPCFAREIAVAATAVSNLCGMGAWVGWCGDV